MILVFADQAEGIIKKSAWEAVSYGAKLSTILNTTVEAVVLGGVNQEQLKALGNYGAAKIHHIADARLDPFDSFVYIDVLAQIADALKPEVFIFSHNSGGKAIAPGLSAKLKAGLVTGAVALPDTSNGFVVKKSVFSGKAFANVAIHSPLKIISLNPNAFGLHETPGNAEIVTDVQVNIPASSITITGTNKVKDTVPLAEAELVVSGGRGLKGPENWGLIENLAKALGAATACSRPVADANWRPHNEHVGQTGGAVAPNLYFAVGISGAIQHLAGVNRSKVIVVINKDPEAPFFKAADYGIVGDLFEVVPKITEAVKKLKGIS